MNNISWKVRRLSVMALLVAIAFILSLIRIPVVLFLEFEAKDSILAISGFTLGPVAGLCTSIATALLEFFLNGASSDTGLYGLLMNIVSSCLFVGIASAFYHKKRTLTGAILGLILGSIAMTAGMLLWDYLIIPLYMTHVSRAAVVPLLWTAFLPFNLLKGAMNAALAMLLYKPLSASLRRAKLPPPAESAQAKARYAVWIATFFVLVTLSLIMLVWSGII